MATLQKARQGVIKHEQIFAAVKDRIVRGELQPGEALPSQSDLMRDYGVALGTVRQVLSRLQAEGLVQSHRGKGSFVRERGALPRSGSGAVVVGYVAFDSSDSTEYNQLVAMRTALARDNIEMQVGIFIPEQVDAALEWTHNMAGVMVWGRPPRKYLERIATSGIEVVMVGNMHEGPCLPDMSHVNVNLQAAMDMSIQYLHSLGHRRLLFVNRGGKDAAPFPEFLQELSNLFKETAQQRIPDGHHAELALDVGETKRLLDYLDSADQPPTALVIEGGQRACGLIHEMEKARWSVPNRISVVAISPLDKRKLANRDLSYAELPSVAMAVRGAEAMREMLRERRVVRESVSPILHWGATCVRAND